MAQEAVDKALRGVNPRTVEPGEYEVILEPYAVVDMLDFFSYLSFGALPFMEDLFVATGENVQLAVREQCDAVFVERLTGRHSVTVLTRVGDHFALHATGVGLVLLAALAVQYIVDGIGGTGLAG